MVWASVCGVCVCGGGGGCGKYIFFLIKNLFFLDGGIFL